MRSLLPTHADNLDLDRLVAAYSYPPAGLEREKSAWLRANMVATVDGAVTGGDSRSGSISTPGDRLIFSLLRGLADVVLVGARTARLEGYGPARASETYSALRARTGQFPAPTVAIVSNRLALDPSAPLFTEAAQPTIVFTSAASPPLARRRLESVADVQIVGERSVDLELMAAALAEQGHARVLCEGGPRLLAELTAAGLLDELCLTVSPLLVGGAIGRILDGASIHQPLALAHLLEEDGSLFTRWTRVEP